MDPQKPDKSSLALSESLGNLLTGSTATKAAGIDLEINVVCAAVDLEILDAEQAEAALMSARDSLKGASDPATEANLLLAEFKAFCMKARVDINDSRKKMNALEKMRVVCRSGLPLLLDDPVRRFEIICDLIRGVYGFDRDNLNWALSDMDLGSWGNDIHRLNGLFHRAELATIAGFLGPDLPRSTASQPECHFKSIDKYGDYYSRGRYYELVGKLESDPSSLEEAVKVYESLELSLPFLEAWKALDRIDQRTRSDISNRAYNAFGQGVTLRMVEAVAAAHQEPVREVSS